MNQKTEGKTPKKARFKFLILLYSLVKHKASAKQCYLEIGAFFLSKGTNYHIGQVVDKRNHGPGRFRVIAVTGMTFDFATKKISHTTRKMVVNADEIEKG